MPLQTEMTDNAPILSDEYLAFPQNAYFASISGLATITLNARNTRLTNHFNLAYISPYRPDKPLTLIVFVRSIRCSFEKKITDPGCGLSCSFQLVHFGFHFQPCSNMRKTLECLRYARSLTRLLSYSEPSSRLQIVKIICSILSCAIIRCYHITILYK